MSKVALDLYAQNFLNQCIANGIQLSEKQNERERHHYRLISILKRPIKLIFDINFLKIQSYSFEDILQDIYLLSECESVLNQA